MVGNWILTSCQPHRVTSGQGVRGSVVEMFSYNNILLFELEEEESSDGVSSNILYRLNKIVKSFGRDYNVYTDAKGSHTHVKDAIVHVRALWKRPACTKSINNLRNVEAGHSTEEEEKTMMVMMTKKCTKTN